MSDSPVAAYIVKKSNGQFKVVGQTYGTAPYGIAIPKKSGLQKPVLGARPTNFETSEKPAAGQGASAHG